MKEQPERYPKLTSEIFAMGGEDKGFVLVEMDNQDQLANLTGVSPSNKVSVRSLTRTVKRFGTGACAADHSVA